ncbi:MAG TPA: DUF2723 domain-containing protein [Anaerolineales bacterium]|nr:DUF2723 domain-containing protein [Anaerolineae bacterium]HIQ01638.1 DUF2723 domain-containing protein [Anaerolineales bacterium]
MREGALERQNKGGRDRLAMAALGLLTFVSRIPFRSHVLYHWDSVNFANGMHHFDVLQEHPHPPGYILYVWLCRLVDLLFHDANATMVWISVVASGLAVVALYLLGRAMWNRRVGVAAALFLASSPLFWFYGEIALPHTLDTFLVLLALWLLYRVWQGEDRLLWPAAVVLGIAGGVRPQTLVFLLPVTLYAAWRLGWKRLLLAGLLGAAVCLAWFLPLVASCGGVGPYLGKMSTYSARFQRSTSVLVGAGWSGVAYNLRKLGLYTAYGAAAALIPLGLYTATRLVRRRWPRRWDRVAFLGLWVAPAGLFYSLIHMGQQGLVFIFLPALLLLGGLGLDRLLPARRGWQAAAALVVAQAAVFCLVPEYPLGPGTQRLLTRETVVRSDRYYGDRFAAVRDNFPPESTLILAANWDHVRYYLPEYTVLPFAAAQDWAGEAHPWGEDPAVEGRTAHLARQEGVAVVLFDPALAAYNDTPALTQGVRLAHGDILAFLRVSEELAFECCRDSFGLVRR